MEDETKCEVSSPKLDVYYLAISTLGFVSISRGFESCCGTGIVLFWEG